MANLKQVFSLSNNKTWIKAMGLIILFFVGLVLIVGLKVNKDLDKIGKEVEESSREGVKKEADNILKILPSDQVASPIIPVSAKTGEISEGFPKDIPLYENMNIIESNSYKDTQTNEITESKVMFQSKKSFETAKAYYEKWAKDNQWQQNVTVLSNQVNNKNIVNLFYTKDNTRSLHITIERLLYDTSKVVLEYKNIDNQKSQKKFEEAFKNIKFEGLPKK